MEHQELDERSLALHRMVAAKIRREPELFDLARQTLGRWQAMPSRACSPYLAQWRVLFELGMQSALDVAEEDSERAAALRQASPFSAVLTSRERQDFLRQWSLDHRPEGAHA